NNSMYSSQSNGYFTGSVTHDAEVGGGERAASLSHFTDDNLEQEEGLSLSHRSTDPEGLGWLRHPQPSGEVRTTGEQTTPSVGYTLEGTRIGAHAQGVHGSQGEDQTQIASGTGSTNQQWRADDGMLNVIPRHHSPRAQTSCRKTTKAAIKVNALNIC